MKLSPNVSASESHSFLGVFRTLRSRSIIIGLAVVLTAIRLPGQEPSDHQRALDLASARDQTTQYLKTVRPALFGNLSGSELTIYNKITFRVTDLEATWKAAGGKEDGVRFVEIDEGVARQMQILAAALIIEKMQNRNVLIPYLRYVAMSMHDNAKFIKDVTSFANVDPDEIDRNPSRHREQIAMVVNGMAFLVAHEVGHHVLGHYDRPRTRDPATLREMEQEADAWAINRCLSARPHFSPMGGLLPLLFAYYTTPHPIARESTADHPAEVRRIHAMFDAMKSSLPDFRDEIVKQGVSYREFKEYIDRTADNYEREIEDDDTPVQELPSATSPRSGDTATDADDPEDDDSSKNRKRKTRNGNYCGDVYGNRYCQMIRPMPLRTACTCSNLPGWGVVVP
jgi:hypothetical protein